MIIPGILEHTWAEIKKKIDIVHNKNLGLPNHAKASRMQIDFCDGKYVESKTWSPIVANIENKTLLDDIVENGLPYWQEFEYEADLMVVDLKSYIDIVVEMGFSHVILHSENLTELIEAAAYAKDKMLTVAISSRYIDVIVLFLENEIYNDIDYIQIMGIDKIGIQGQPFSESVTSKISKISKIIKDKKLNIYVQVDGAMSADTIDICRQAGAQSFVMGSAYFKIKI